MISVQGGLHLPEATFALSPSHPELRGLFAAANTALCCHTRQSYKSLASQPQQNALAAAGGHHLFANPPAPPLCPVFPKWKCCSAATVCSRLPWLGAIPCTDPFPQSKHIFPDQVTTGFSGLDTKAECGQKQQDAQELQNYHWPV